MSDDSDEICEIELARQEVRYDMPPEEEQAAGYSTDGSTRPILPRPPAAAGEDNTTPPGDEIEEPRLTFKDVKNALSNSQFLTRTVFFAATAYFMVILQQRPNAPALMKHTPSITNRMQFEFSVEMVLAFSMVTGLHIVLQLLEFVYTSAPRITRGFALIGPWSLKIKENSIIEV
ncbi:uncharacterized protein LOC107303596 [Oryza brachyantha]|uniref:uncharacterized protein LOC107303596 n=1 Tax=Oryza brachyantha TaxID=4533 RepID=UPI0007762289|nr:uncharacterized protein LOC107303596 [Oryza brachyantha]